MKMEQTIDIDAPPEKVYEVLMDPHRLGDWVTIHGGLETKHDGSLKIGEELVQKLKVAGQKFKVHWTVVKDGQRRIEWNGKGPMGSKAKVVYDLEPRDGGTRFCYMNEYAAPGGPIGALAARAVSGKARSEGRKSLEKLKRLLES
jgi:carbon monoxide dehydrogenase subunit G